MYRGRSLRSSRSSRRRNDSEEETVILDYNKAPHENVLDILTHVVKKDGISKARRLGYLNCLVKLSKDYNQNQLGFSSSEIFCCLRVSLYHEASDVRAAGLRAVRYLLKDAESVLAFCQSHIPYFVARSLDIVLDNRVERVHALRLSRKVLCTYPLAFPNSLLACLVALAKDGHEERDPLIRACVGTLGELALLCPQLCYAQKGLLDSLMTNILHCSPQQPQMAEALLGVLLCMLNHPATRERFWSELRLERLMAPLTDCQHTGSGDRGEGMSKYCPFSQERANQMRVSQQALISTLHSWPGLIYLCHIDNCIIPTFVELLLLPYSDTRKMVLDLLFDLFALPVPEWTDDIKGAVASADPCSWQESWQLYEGFVAAEGRDILPHLAEHRPNLVENYLSLLLLVFVNSGVLEALVEVSTCEDPFLACFSLILLGELLHMCSRLLPPDVSHQCQCLPSLLALATSSEVEPLRRSRASSAISCLDRLHLLKKRGPVPASLFLDHLLQQTSPLSASSSSASSKPYLNTSKTENAAFYHWAVSKAKLQSCMRKETDESTMISIRDTQVLNKKFQNWDWELIGSLLKSPGDILKRLEDSTCRHFVRNLIEFFKPSSNDRSQFSNYENSQDRSLQEICMVGFHFLDFLLEAEESRANEILQELLMDLVRCLEEVNQETVALGATLSPSRVGQSGQYYFLFIGHLSVHNKGVKLLEASRIFELLLEIVGRPNHDIYVNLIVSSFDYTKDDFCRTLLNKVLTASSNNGRLYATNYLRVLLRASVNDFRKWGIEMLINQLYDKNKAVSLAALDILDEACEVKDNLESLISLRPSLLHLGDKGLLLLLRFLSLPSGFKFLHDANFIDYELEKWNKVNNLKYVKIVENCLNESLSRHKKGPDGTYGRRSAATSRNLLGQAFLPPHLYGQLSQHVEGLAFLQHQCDDPLEKHFKVIRQDDKLSEEGQDRLASFNETQVLELKASLWTIGHIGTTSLGFFIVQEADVISTIVDMACQASILSIRGTCFYILGLLGSSKEGADALSLLAWESIRHSHHQKWPVLSQALEQHQLLRYDPLQGSVSLIAEEQLLKGHRQHSWSVSSGGSHISEWLTKGLTRRGDHIRLRQDSESSCASMPEEELIRTSEMGRSQSFQAHEDDFDAATFAHLSSLVAQPLPTSSTLPRNLHLSPLRNCSPKTSKNTNLLLAVDESRPRSVSDEHPLKQRSVSDYSDTKEPLQTVSSLRGSRDSGNCEESKGLTSLEASEVKIGQEKVPSRTLNPTMAVSKSRSGSCTDSTTSGVSSCDSNPANHHREGFSFPNQPQQAMLSPIPSSTSLNTLVSLRKNSQAALATSYAPSVASMGAQNSGPTSPSTLATTLSSTLSSFGFTTARDARGYATLRAIQRRRRVQSMGGGEANGTGRRNTLSACFIETIKRNSSQIFLEQKEFVGPHERRKSLEAGFTQASFGQLPPTSSQTSVEAYMGLCLPINLALIFSGKLNKVPIVDEFLGPTDDDITRKDVFDFENDFVLHTDENCLACHQVVKPNLPALRITNISEEGQEAETDYGRCPSLIESSKKRNGNKELLRKEVLRFVTNLSSSLGVKQSEQGLLSLKQKFPQAFHDLCLYTEVCLQMAEYNFRLTVRRFLQELFLDLPFTEVFLQAEDILASHHAANFVDLDPDHYREKNS